MTNMKHTLYSDDAYKRSIEYNDRLMETIFAPVVTNADDAAKMVDAMFGENATPEKMKAAVKQFNIALRAPHDMTHGFKNEILVRTKTISNSVMPLMPAQIAVFQSNADERDLDTQWMQWIAEDALSGALSATIVDIANLIEFEDVPAETSDVPLKDFLAAVWQDIRPEWKKAGVKIAYSILRLDPLQSLNAIAAGLRIKAMVKKNRDMYTATQAGIAAANTATYTTAFNTNIQRTINAGRITLFERLANSGYEFNMNSPVVLLANEIQRDRIEPAFTLTNFVPFGTITVSYPVSRVYSFKVASDLGISGNKAVLIAPYRKNRVGTFNPLQIQNIQQPLNNAHIIWGQMAYNTIIEETQFQIINLS